MRLITRDDFIETYCKLKQRGPAFLRSKLNFNPTHRTLSSFDDTKLESANWWIVPEIKYRWNRKISNNPNLKYEDYFVEEYLQDRNNLKLISIGSGACSHEISLARHAAFKMISCHDIAGKQLVKAERIAHHLGLSNIEFINKGIEALKWSHGQYDVFMFHQSLHHLKNIDQLLESISQGLKPNGFLLLHEYVGPNRLIWNKAQLQRANQILHTIPRKWRRRFKTNIVKNRIYGPGLLRMKISDPSEAVESENIRPALKQYFEKLEEKQLGGNLLCLVLKDISHHFVELNAEKRAILERLFHEEDKFLENHNSDMVFGVYKSK